MKLERIRPTTFKVTLHTYELAALISAARWAVDGAEGELPREARGQLSNILADYDSESERINNKKTTS